MGFRKNSQSLLYVNVRICKFCCSVPICPVYPVYKQFVAPLNKVIALLGSVKLAVAKIINSWGKNHQLP